eukprot:794825-Prymnesium_polylepis.1
MVSCTCTEEPRVPRKNDHAARADARGAARAARPRLAARAGARRARVERPPRVTMQSNASGHK